MQSSEADKTAQIQQLEEWLAAAIASGNLDSAMPAARSLLELHPGSARAWYVLAACIPATPEDLECMPEDPLSCLLRATELDPDFAEAWAELGFLYLRENDVTGALRAGDRAARLDPKNIQAMIIRARIHQQEGNYRKAVSILRRGKPQAADATLPALRLARLYYDCGHEPAALAECKTVLKSRPDCLEALTLAGMIEQFDFNGDCGLSRFERLAILEPENPWHWQGLGLAQALQGKFENSRTSLLMAHRLDPEDVQIRLRLGLTLFFLEEDREEGEEWIDAALADCRWRNDVDLGALFLVPLFVLRDINAPGLLDVTRKLRAASHWLPEKHRGDGPKDRDESTTAANADGRSSSDALTGNSGPDTADYWLDAANDSLLFERRDEAILQLFRALEIHPEHPGAAARLSELNSGRSSDGAGGSGTNRGSGAGRESSGTTSRSEP